MLPFKARALGLVLATIAVTLLYGASAQSFQNCNNGDSFASLGLLSSVLKCVNVSVSQALSYMDTLETSAYGRGCLENPSLDNKDCVTTTIDVLRTSATSPGSVPFIVGNRIFYAPQAVCSCALKAVSSYKFANPKCTGAKLKTQIEKLSKVCPRLPSSASNLALFSGCNNADASRAVYLGMKQLTCMGVQGPTIKLMMDNLHAMNDAQMNDLKTCVESRFNLALPSCVNTLSLWAKGANDPQSAASIVNKAVIHDVSKSCGCVSSSSGDPLASSMTPNCNLDGVVDILRSGNQMCSSPATLQTQINKATVGCSDGDIMNAEIAFAMYGSCFDINTKNVRVSASYMNALNMRSASNCLLDFVPSNPQCTNMLNNAAYHAVRDPGSIAAKAAEQLQNNSEGFCKCLAQNAQNQFSSAVSTNCANLRKALDRPATTKAQYTCAAMKGVPPSKWAQTFADSGKPVPAPAPAPAAPEPKISAPVDPTPAAPILTPPAEPVTVPVPKPSEPAVPVPQPEPKAPQPPAQAQPPVTEPPKPQAPAPVAEPPKAQTPAPEPPKPQPVTEPPKPQPKPPQSPPKPNIIDPESCLGRSLILCGKQGTNQKKFLKCAAGNLKSGGISTNCYNFIQAMTDYDTNNCAMNMVAKCPLDKYTTSETLLSCNVNYGAGMPGAPRGVNKRSVEKCDIILGDIKPSVRCFAEVASLVNEDNQIDIDPQTGQSLPTALLLSPSEYFSRVRSLVGHLDSSCNNWILTPF